MSKPQLGQPATVKECIADKIVDHRGHHKSTEWVCTVDESWQPYSEYCKGETS